MNKNEKIISKLYDDLKNIRLLQYSTYIYSSLYIAEKTKNEYEPDGNMESSFIVMSNSINAKLKDINDTSDYIPTEIYTARLKVANYKLALQELQSFCEVENISTNMSYFNYMSKLEKVNSDCDNAYIEALDEIKNLKEILKKEN